jgi:DNA-binding PadR family transcriptional regulator
MQELAHHGYSLSSGTIYPILHEMERNHILWSKKVNVGGKLRKIYRTTSLGNKILGNLQVFVGELSREVL